MRLQRPFSEHGAERRKPYQSDSGIVAPHAGLSVWSHSWCCVCDQLPVAASTTSGTMTKTTSMTTQPALVPFSGTCRYQLAVLLEGDCVRQVICTVRQAPTRGRAAIRETRSQMTPNGYGGELLFRNSDLRILFGNRDGEARDSVAAINAATLLDATPEALVDELLERFQVEPLRLNDPTSEVVGLTVEQPDGWGERGPVEGTLLRLRVPFTGEPPLLRLRPSDCTGPVPRGQVDRQALVLEQWWPQAPSGEEMTRWGNGELRSLRHWIACQEPMITNFNASLRADLRKLVGQRRDLELRRRHLQAALPYGIHRRDDAPLTYALGGIVRKRIDLSGSPRTAAGQPPTPEPRLTDDQFNEILATVRAIGHSMERMPKAFAELYEEQLRAVFLAALNAQFDGAATAETFNYRGKTDILIRTNDRNVLIGECKIWRGPAAFRGNRDAYGVVDQVLEYAAWRDAWAAILLFVRGKEPTQVFAQVSGLLAEHENIREVRQVGDSEWRCRLKQRDDPLRELTLAVTAFHFPT